MKRQYFYEVYNVLNGKKATFNNLNALKIALALYYQEEKPFIRIFKRWTKKES
jgi:hypothetical protein